MKQTQAQDKVQQHNKNPSRKVVLKNHESTRQKNHEDPWGIHLAMTHNMNINIA